MNRPPGIETLHEYRIHYVDQDDGTGREVRATVDRHRAAITVELPDGSRTTLDVVTARALYMVLWESVYSSLEPSGPYLRLERNTGEGWSAPAGAAR
ncbi:MAG: hypothetical protein ACRDT6_19895 [Micromonosporaceae bacterium]